MLTTTTTTTHALDADEAHQIKQALLRHMPLSPVSAAEELIRAFRLVDEATVSAAAAAAACSDSSTGKSA